MLENILAFYGIHPKSTVQPYGSGLINNTWKVTEGNRQFILQKINRNVFREPEKIDSNIAGLASFLKKHHPGYLFPTPLKTRDDQFMARVEGEYFRLFPFVPESHSIDVASTPEEAFEAARQFGRFTRLLSEFPVGELQITIPDFHNLNLRYLKFRESVSTDSCGRKKTATDAISAVHDNEHIVRIYQNIVQSPHFRLRVTHHDTKISNVLFNDSKTGLCVIDLDTVMPGYFISDVGDMMRTYLSPTSEEDNDLDSIEVRDEYFHAIAGGYLSEMADELSPEEIHHFLFSGKFLIYMQAVRFLTDYLMGDVYYPVKYADHNLVRAKR